MSTRQIALGYQSTCAGHRCWLDSFPPMLLDRGRMGLCTCFAVLSCMCTCHLHVWGAIYARLCFASTSQAALLLVQRPPPVSIAVFDNFHAYPAVARATHASVPCADLTPTPHAPLPPCPAGPMLTWLAKSWWPSTRPSSSWLAQHLQSSLQTWPCRPLRLSRYALGFFMFWCGCLGSVLCCLAAVRALVLLCAIDW